jgi:hypothetical protein
VGVQGKGLVSERLWPLMPLTCQYTGLKAVMRSHAFCRKLFFSCSLGATSVPGA